MSFSRGERGRVALSGNSLIAAAPWNRQDKGFHLLFFTKNKHPRELGAEPAPAMVDYTAICGVELEGRKMPTYLLKRFLCWHKAVACVLTHTGHELHKSLVEMPKFTLGEITLWPAFRLLRRKSPGSYLMIFFPLCIWNTR